MTAIAALTLLAGLLAGADAEEAPQDFGTIELDYRLARKWQFDLPAERFVKLGEAFPFADDRFGVELDGTTLVVDADGNGEGEVRITTADLEKTPIRFLVLRGDGEGDEFTYAVRLTNQKGWKFAPSGSMVGKLGETKIQLIDQNGNGRYDDYGEDAMIVGRSKAASFLSHVVRVGGALYDIEVAPDGRSIGTSAHVGETGSLDLVSNYRTKAKLKTVIIVDAEQGLSFDLGRASEAVKLPVGSYRLHSGRVVLGDGEVSIGAGRLSAIRVLSGISTSLEWGGPLSAEFEFERVGGELRFSPDKLWYYGRAGETYSGWNPRGLAPEFSVKEKQSGEELVNVKFPGSC